MLVVEGVKVLATWDLHQPKSDLEDVALSGKVQETTHYAARLLLAVLEERLFLLVVIAETNQAESRHCAGELEVVHAQDREGEFRKVNSITTP
jgi:hypothetical protein